jgi:hypothetical protein
MGKVSDDALFAQWTREGNTTKPTVQRIYITTPGVTVNEYFENMAKMVTKSGEVDHDMGNLFTSLRIMQIISTENSNFD